MSREISERDATLAVEGAAKHCYERSVANYAAEVPSWDELSMVDKRNVKDAILGIVWAALEALPDQRHTAWLEGYIAADNGRDVDTNPYPEEAL